jgi:predicted DNA-binding transcriptional regulator YafY
VILDPSYRRTGLQLTLGEMISLRFGRTLFTFLENTTFAADMNQAIDRLGPTLSRASTDVVQDFDRMFIAVPEPTKNYEETAEIQDEILSALVYRNPIDVEYRPARGEKKNYKLEPYTIAAYRQGLYLFARDTAVDRVKTFAFERFRRATRLRKERFSPPQDWDPGAFVADAFGITVGRPQAVVVRFSAEVAEFIQERTWHRSQGFQPRRDGSVEIILRCAITPELKQWILGFGADAEVLEPESLREEIRGALTAAARRYGTGS